MEQMSSRRILQGLRSKEFSSFEITQEYLGIIKRNSILNAVAFIDEESALREARRSDQALADGVNLPLLGLPLSIKDSIAVKGMPWRSGSFARENVVAEKDATTVARLRDAGAFFLCKTTTPEYTWSVETDSALHGRTSNPYDMGRTCGGSSGGEAVLHAIGGSPAGLGSDGLNSIRVPAHFCGTAGLRPTAGVVPETGVWPSTRGSGLMDISTVGPMAWAAEDLNLLLPIIQGYDGLDPFTHCLCAHRDDNSLSGMRIGYFTSHPFAPADPSVQQAVVTAAEAARDGGAEIQEISPWKLENVIDIAFSLMAPDGGERVRADVSAAEGRHAPSFAALMQQLKSQKLTISQYLSKVEEFIATRAAIRTAVSSFDAIICPVASSFAPEHLSSVEAGGEGLSIEGYTYSFAIALAGLPSASVPILKTPEGLPVGVQVICPQHQDFKAGEIARILQKTLGSFFSPQKK
jgi:amidase